MQYKSLLLLLSIQAYAASGECGDDGTTSCSAVAADSIQSDALLAMKLTTQSALLEISAAVDKAKKCGANKKSDCAALVETCLKLPDQTDDTCQSYVEGKHEKCEVCFECDKMFSQCLSVSSESSCKAHLAEKCPALSSAGLVEIVEAGDKAKKCGANKKSDCAALVETCLKLPDQTDDTCQSYVEGKHEKCEVCFECDKMFSQCLSVSSESSCKAHLAQKCPALSSAGLVEIVKAGDKAKKCGANKKSDCAALVETCLKLPDQTEDTCQSYVEGKHVKCEVCFECDKMFSQCLSVSSESSCKAHLAEKCPALSSVSLAGLA